MFGRWAWHMCSALLWHVQEPEHVIYLKLDTPVALHRIGTGSLLHCSAAPIADVAAATAAAPE